jgi:hypothetical protein
MKLGRLLAMCNFGLQPQIPRGINEFSFALAGISKCPRNTCAHTLMRTYVLALHRRGITVKTAWHRYGVWRCYGHPLIGPTGNSGPLHRTECFLKALRMLPFSQAQKPQSHMLSFSAPGSEDMGALSFILGQLKSPETANVPAELSHTQNNAHPEPPARRPPRITPRVALRSEQTKNSTAAFGCPHDVVQCP